MKSICKLLTLYRVPEDDTEEIELRVYCIESQQFALKKTADTLRKNSWLQIEDESSDFVITSGDKITFDLSGSVKLIAGLPSPNLTYLKGGTSFVQTQLQFFDADQKRGFLQMFHQNNVVDLKKLMWKCLRENYEGT